MLLRNKVPQRRTNPTRTPTGNNWSEHKPDLRVDFNCHCAYCDSYDGFRNAYYEVDHFIPKLILKRKNASISLTEYTNLVYSCRYCNNAKRSKWPTQSITKPHNGKKGFVDPCSVELDNHLCRTPDGSIMWKTNLGKWMWKEAFKFDERQKSIQLLWNLNKLRLILDQLVEEMENFTENSPERELIKKEAGKISLKYYSIHKALMEFYQ